MAEKRGVDAGELLRKAFERLAPAAAYMVSPEAGLAASVAVFATWLIARARRRRGVEGFVEDLHAELIELSARIDEKKRRVELLRRELSKLGDEYRRRILEQAIEAEEEALRNLVEEYELHQLRIMALERLRELGGDRLLREVLEIVRALERGRGVEERQLEILKELEERWRRRQLEISVLQRIIGYG